VTHCKYFINLHGFSLVLSYFCKSMAENQRNTGYVILIIALMLFFFSFIQREKEKNIPEYSKSSFVVSVGAISSAKAIIVPATSNPEKNLSWINTIDGKYSFLDCTSSREIIVNKQIFSHFCSCRLKFLSKKPIIGLIFLQKIPGQEKGDYPLLIS